MSASSPPVQPAAPSRDPFATTGLEQGLGRRVARGFAFTFGGQVLRFVINFGGLALLARLLSQEDYGVYGIVMAFYAVAAVSQDLGLSQATVQRPEITREQVSTLFWLNAGLGAALTLVGIAISPLLAQLYQEPELTTIGMASSLGFLLAGLGVQHGALHRRRMEFGFLTLATLAANLASVLVAVGLAWAGAGPWALVAMSLVLTGGTTVIWWCRMPWLPGWPRRGAGVQPMLTFGVKLSGATALNSFCQNLDAMLLGCFHGTFAVGAYTRASSLMLQPMQQFFTPLQSVAVPALSRAAADPVQLARLYFRLFRLVCLFGAVSVPLLFAGADSVVAILLGRGWEKTATILMAFGPAMFAIPAAGVVQWLLVATGRSDAYLRFAVINNLVFVVMVALGAWYGAVGVALAYAASTLLVRMPLMFWFAGRVCPHGLADHLREALPFALLATLWALALLAVRIGTAGWNPILELAALGLAFAGIAGGSLFSFGFGRSLVAEARSTVAQLRSRTS